MLPLVPSVASTTSALGSDWDVEAEIAKELQDLEDDVSYDLQASHQQPQQQHHHCSAHAGAAPVEALWAALSARDHLADKLTATLYELESLPQPHVQASVKVLATASAEQVTAAVAALSRVAGCNQQLAATDGPPEPSPGGEESGSHKPSAPAQAPAASSTYQPAAQQVQAVFSDGQIQPSIVVLQEKQAHAVQVPEYPCTAPKREQDTSTAQSLQQCAASPARATAEVKPAKPASETQPESPTAFEIGKTSPARPQLSSPHTPNTEDKRQHAAAAALLVQQQAGQPQPQLVFESSSEESTEAAEAPSTSPISVAATPVQAVAAAAAAAVAAEQDAAAEADRQRQQEQSKLQQLLQQQAAAAAARQAAQAAARQQLQQQAEAAAVSYVASWRIARAWQTYRRSPAHAAKLSAVVALQAAVRGAAARRLLEQMRRHNQLLLALQAAAASGQLAAMQQAAEEACTAGLGEDAQHALQRFQAATQAAATDLQRAADIGTHAAFTVAAAAAAKFSTLGDTCRTCAARFRDRQEAAAQAVQAAVLALPLPQVQCAVNVALELGVPGKDLAAALEAARARDDAAVAELSAVVKELSTHSASILARCCKSTDSTVTAATEAAAASDLSCDADACTFDFGRFVDVAAACRQYGRVQEAAAADAVLQVCRQTAAAQLAEAARQAPCAEPIQWLLSWCGQLGALQQECTAAAGVLSERQQQLCILMDSLLQQPGSSASTIQQLVQQAKALGVPAGAVAAAEEQLQKRQHAVKQQCLEAAQTGSLQQLQAAMMSAEQQGVDTKVLQQCCELMQERQQDAARCLASAAAGLCAAVKGPVGGTDSQQLLQALQQLVRCCRQHSTEAGNSSTTHTCSSSSSSSSHALAQKQQEAEATSSLHMQDVEKQAAGCLELGLAINVVAALQAVAAACQTQLHNRASILAVCSQPLDGQTYGATSAVDGVPHQQQRLQQPACLWEEGAWPEQPWVQQDSTVVHSALPGWAPAHCTSRGSSGKDCSSSGAAYLDASILTVPQHSAEHCHLATPVLQLQRDWAANLQGALAASHMQSAAAGTHSPPQPQHIPKQPVTKQQQQQQQKASNWLHKLLTANAAAPLEQLTQLDLSLEQLPGLHGLELLCPQLTSIAVNMNGLRTIEGLQGCSELLQLSAQDNQLQQVPDIACHPRLSCLLLDSNKLRSIIPAAEAASFSAPDGTGSCSSGSYSGTWRQTHTALQVLSLANNQLNNICGSAGTSHSKPSQAGSTGTFSSSGSASRGPPSIDRAPGSSEGCRLHRLSMWLPGLQVLQLSGNQLQDLSGLEGCVNLRVLDVSRNQLTDLQGIAGCHLLQHMDVSDNKLATFPQELHLPLLQRLNLSCNAMKVWPSLPPLPHLAQLNLADNQIKHLPEMHGLGHIRTLDLSFNALEDLDDCITALQTAPQLQELQLHDNAFHIRYQQGGDAEQPWLAAAAAAGRVVAAGAAAAAYEQWVREQIGSGLPWLVKLDGDEVTEAERLPDSLWGPAQQQLVHRPQQQQQQQRDGLQGTIQGIRSAGSSRQQAVTIATGRLVASNVMLSLLVAQHMKAGLVGGLGLTLHLSASSSAAAVLCSEPGQGGVASGAACLWVAALQAAAAWLPWLVQSGSCSCSSSSRRAGSSVLEARADAQQLPCQHLQQLQQLDSGCSVCSYCCEGPPRSSSSSSSSRHSGVQTGALTQCPAWLHQVEAQWCYSTRAWLVEMQAAEQAAARKSSSSTSGRLAHLDSSGSASFSQMTAGQAFVTARLAREHLLQLQQQSGRAHQQQLVSLPSFIAAAQEQLAVAAVMLQSSWRAFVARQRYKQQLQQQRRYDAAVVLQAAWRGCSSRRRVASMSHQHQQQQQREAAAAAVVKIQAALRGHKVRQRLKAALSAARAAAGAAVGVHGHGQRPHQHPASAPAAAAAGGTGSAHVQQEISQQGVQAATAAATAAGDGDWDDFSGVPDDFVSLQADLLDDVLLPGDVDHQGTHPGSAQPENQQQQQQGDSSWATAVSAIASAASIIAASAAVGPAGEASDALGQHGCGAASTYEAKITALMAEWGFTDRATAEAYYKRQKHTLKAVAKHKLEQQLKDPAARLKRLQTQLGNGTGSSSSPSAAAAAAAATAAVSKSPSGSGAISSTSAGALVSRGSETCARAVVKHLSLQQQRSKAAEPFSRVSSMSGNGSSSCSGSSRRETTGSSSGRLLKHSASTRSDAGHTAVYSEGHKQQQQQLVQSASLSRSCSQKQHQQGLSLPSISLPSSAASSTANAGGQTSADGALPKLQRL